MKTTRAADANRAVLHAVDHMQFNHYGANVVEVFDENTGELHGVITYAPDGEIHIAYRRKVQEKYERRPRAA